MNSPVDPALLQLVQQEVKSLQDSFDNMSLACEAEKVKINQELEKIAVSLEEMKQRLHRLETGQGPWSIVLILLMAEWMILKVCLGEMNQLTIANVIM